MHKYSIEDNIDFFSELYKLLDDNTIEDKKNESICLISNENLIDKFVTLECGHKFNYIPLYYDIKNHKEKYNNMETHNNHLNHNEIRCPYCRNKQKTVLPYYAELNLKKIQGVNDYNPNYNQSQQYLLNWKKCNYNSEDDYNCDVLGTQINYYNGHYNGDNYFDEKYYCCYHKKIMIKKYKKEISDKLKKELKQKKLMEIDKIKEDFKQTKIKEKEELKQTKIKEKEELKQKKIKEKEELKQTKIKEKEELKQKKIKEKEELKQKKINK